MALRKMGVMAGLCLGSLIFLTGCSFSQVLDTWMGTAVESTADVSAVSTASQQKEAKKVDENLESPVFTRDLSGTMQMVQGTEYALQAEASVSDGGEVTYQWYSNNVESNGGGTVLQGAVSETYTVDTSETGTTYYYVVATNEHGENISLATSGVAGVTVTEPGEWTQEAEGGWSYALPDGTKPLNTWMIIEGKTYYFRENGCRATGWTSIAEIEYYFNENGELQRNASVPGGGSTDENGAKVS